MIERLTTRTNANGYAYQVEIDHDAHTVENGYFIFRRDCVTALTVGRREIDKYVKALITNGYTRI